MRKLRWFWYLLGLVCLVHQPVLAQVPSPGAVQKERIVLLGGTIHVGNGQVLDNGFVVFEAGKITAVGQGTAPTGAGKVIDVKGKRVYPGLISLNTPLGLTEVDAVRATVDMTESGNLNPNARALIAYNTDSDIIPTIRSNGILLAQTTPRGGLLSGTSSVVQLDAWNWEDAAYKADDAVHINFPPSFQRTGWWAEPGGSEKNKEREKAVQIIETLLSDASNYAKQSNSKDFNIKLESLKGLFDGRKKLFVHLEAAQDFIEAHKLSLKYGVKQVVWVGGNECHLIVDYLKQNNVAVVLERLYRLPDKMDDDVDLPYRQPYLLQQAGVIYSFDYSGDMEVMGSRNLPFVAGAAVRYGLTKEQALGAISLNAARILGIDQRVGSLEVGKDANIVVSDGDLLDVATNKVGLAFIQGRSVNLDDKQKQLNRKFAEKYGVK